jgi:ABC-type thiamin/hydroxymethylpyrimidine transport system permease subunit
VQNAFKTPFKGVFCIYTDMTKFIKKYSILEIIIIALMAALGLATKPIIVPITHMITGPLFIPGGAVAGGFYMMWIVLSASLVNKRGAATLTALTQALIVMVSGSFGSHGIISVVTYSIPGIMVDLFLLIFKRNFNSKIDFFIAGIVANISGTYLSNLVFFRLPLIPLAISLLSGSISGGLGGLVAYLIKKQLDKFGIEEYLNTGSEV